MKYSKEFKGTRRNYFWPAQFSKQDGFLRIAQSRGDGKGIEIVLLSRSQVRAMMEFYKPEKKKAKP
jgi:hypothetical protein